MFRPVAQPHLEQLVRKASPDLGAADDLLELLIEAIVAARPVDVGSNGGNEELEELPQIALERVIPGRIVVVRYSRALGYGPDYIAA
jgi:hypothetical protein